MHRFFLCAAVALGLLTAPALADGNFVRFDNIQGSATEAQHQGWIQTGQWGTDQKKGFWLFSSPKCQFWFEKKADASSSALQRALQNKTFFERVLFDVSIKGTVLRTTFHAVRIVAVETVGGTEKITLQFKSQTDRQITLPSS